MRPGQIVLKSREKDALDQAVFAAYGWPEGNGDEEILKNLLALNLERSEEQGLL
jgi:hypothetical protein